MVKRKASIPALVYRGTPVGFGAIPSGTVYSGQLVTIRGWGILSGADFVATGANNVVPIVQAVQSSQVGASGSYSGSRYGVVGVALGDAPIQATYQQLQMGKPLANATNVTQYTITTDTDVRRMALITPNDAVQLWLPLSGTAPTAGQYLTLSSGVDGAVEVTTTPETDFTIGQAWGYSTDANFSGVTVPGIQKYVLTVLDFKYGGTSSGDIL